MIVYPINPNVIRIPIVTTGCCQTQFDSTYPMQLNGIISQEEFRQSIENINRASPSKYPILICSILFVLCILTGMALFIAGGITAVNSRSFGFPVLVGIGLGIFLFGMICIMGSCISIAMRSSIQMRKAVKKESDQYSQRSLKPSTWRLMTQTIRNGNGRYSTTISHISIELGGSTSNSIPMGGYSAPFLVQPNGNGFCPFCGAPKSSSDAKFCASCGKSL